MVQLKVNVAVCSSQLHQLFQFLMVQLKAVSTGNFPDK